MPRVRIRVWWLMAAVAVVALATRGCIWVELMERRADYFRDQARMHARLAQECRDIAESVPGHQTRARRWSEHHESLRKTYDRAAANPWFAVPPDPPSPY